MCRCSHVIAPLEAAFLTTIASDSHPQHQNCSFFARMAHNSPRTRKQRETLSTDTQYASVIPNDYSWYRPLDTTQREIRVLYLEPEPLDSLKDVVVHVFN